MQQKSNIENDLFLQAAGWKRYEFQSVLMTISQLSMVPFIWNSTMSARSKTSEHLLVEWHQLQNLSRLRQKWLAKNGTMRHWNKSSFWLDKNSNYRTMFPVVLQNIDPPCQTHFWSNSFSNPEVPYLGIKPRWDLMTHKLWVILSD